MMHESRPGGRRVAKTKLPGSRRGSGFWNPERLGESAAGQTMSPWYVPCGCRRGPTSRYLSCVSVGPVCIQIARIWGSDHSHGRDLLCRRAGGSVVLYSRLKATLWVTPARPLSMDRSCQGLRVWQPSHSAYQST